MWAKTVVTWDFTAGAHGWTGNRQVANLAVTSEGLAFDSTGNDPWIEGPATDLPAEGLTRVRVRMKSDADGSGELFYGPTFRGGHSVRFTIRADGQWHDYAALIQEPLGPGTRFRLDPAVSEGHMVVSSIEVEALPTIEAPPLEKPQRPVARETASASISSGPLVLEHYRGRWGDFVVKVDGTEMAAGYHAGLVGLILDDKAQWLTFDGADFGFTGGRDGEIVCRASLKDSGSAQWQVTRRFERGPQDGTIVVGTEFVVDQDRQVIHLPWLTLFAGLETFGQRKTQGLLAGLEYLADEPSSSEADITGPEHVRRIPDPVKIAFPLMAIAHDGRHTGLIWEPSGLTAAAFDSPDTIYDSGAHVMGLSAPAVGESRFENHGVAHTPFVLKAGQPVKARAIIIGGPGETVVAAVKKYVELKGLPDVPQFEGGLDEAVTLLAHGWLDSAINEGGLFRHAVWGDKFRAGPAGDAPMYIDWLAHHVKDEDLADRLVQARDLAVTNMPPGQPYTSAVSHTKTPTAPFVFGGVYPYVKQQQDRAKALLRHFDERGVKPYRPGKVDYGKTHFADHANGYAAVDAVRLLEAATMSADPELIDAGLGLLDKLTALYANTVPRGAQVWEIPLHTPDILASAHLVKAYALGYIIGGKPEHLEQARYWAWTGVPFVYLVNPTDGDVGPYATIAVLGATNWKAPVWFGLPVQWCGLVYASALHTLDQCDPDGPWAQIARGITATGLQMTWPTSDEKRQGLLPDFFKFRAQYRDGPAINPGTVQAHVPELFGLGKLYDVRKIERTGWFLHAPCAIRDVEEARDSLSFTVDGWGTKTYYVLVSGMQKQPARVTVQRVEGNSPVEPARAHFNAEQKLMTITLRERKRIRLLL
jgi:hypothetical protein